MSCTLHIQYEKYLKYLVIWGRYLGEGCWPVVHDGAGVVRGAEVVNLAEVVLEEVHLHARPEDAAVVAAVAVVV